MASSKKTLVVSEGQIDSMIRSIRGVRVMLYSDLAKIYGVPTFRFNEAIKRNRYRFPADFMFQLTREEFDALKSQIAMSKPQNSSQIAMSSGKHRGATYRPYAFTKHGALQAANVLRSLTAAANLYIVAFAVSWGPVMWVLLGEMFPNEIRGAALAISGATNWAANFTVTVTFLPLLKGVGLTRAYVFYAIAAAISLPFVWLTVCETKDKTLEQMKDSTQLEPRIRGAAD